MEAKKQGDAALVRSLTYNEEEENKKKDPREEKVRGCTSFEFELNLL